MLVMEVMILISIMMLMVMMSCMTTYFLVRAFPYCSSDTSLAPCLPLAFV